MSETQRYDLSLLSDNALIDRQIEIQSKIAIASRYGSGGAVQQLQTINAEIERILRERFVPKPKNETPVILDTDPPAESRLPEATPSKPTDQPARRTVPRSSRPSTEIDLSKP